MNNALTDEIDRLRAELKEAKALLAFAYIAFGDREPYRADWLKRAKELLKEG